MTTSQIESRIWAMADAAARDAHKSMMETGGMGEQYLYYSPGVPGGAWGELATGPDAPDSFILADNRRLSPALDLCQLTRAIHTIVRRLPILGDC